MIGASYSRPTPSQTTIGVSSNLGFPRFGLRDGGVEIEWEKRGEVTVIMAIGRSDEKLKGMAIGDWPIGLYRDRRRRER